MTTSADIRVALKKQFPHPEYGIVFEVAQGTGWKANRHLDAMAMGVWPSRGLVLHGIEIKVSRGDWRRELAMPEKAEEIARFCDFFWLAAPQGVVPINELPKNWGLLELANGKLKQAKYPEKLKAQPHTRDLMAAVFRAACRPAPAAEVAAAITDARASIREEFEKTYEKRLANELSNRGFRDGQAAEKWRAMIAALGENDWTSEKELIAAVRLVMALGIANSSDGVNTVLRVMENAAKQVRDAMTPLSIPQAGGA